MKKSSELRQERQAEIDAQRVIVNLTSKEKRNMSAEEETSFDAHQTRIDALKVEIERAEKFEENQRTAAAAAASVVPGTSDGEAKELAKMKRAFSITKAITSVKANRALDGIEAEMSQMALEENQRAGVKSAPGANLHIPSFVFRADAQTVSEDAGSYGGFSVVDQAPRAQVGFTPKLFLEELGATRLSGLTGGAIPMPVYNDYAFAWLTETGAITSQKNTISGPTLDPKRLGAAVPISNRYLLQSSVGDSLIMQKLAKGYDNALQTAAINGAGTGNVPKGILNTTGVGLSATTIASNATWAMMVELQGLIEQANATGESLHYLMSPRLKATLKSIQKDSGSGRFLMEGNNIDGVNAHATSLVPELAGNDVLIYGDFSQLFIGEWGAISLQVDPYSLLKNDSVEIVVNAHADVAIAQPGAFAVNKFLN